MTENLWKMSIYAVLPIVLAVIVRKPLRKYPKEYSFGLWFVVFFRLWVPLFIESAFSIQPRLSFTAPRVCKYLYLLGACVTAGIFLAQYIRMRKYTKPAVREVKNIWRCDRISSAFVTGLIRPKIYLPYGLEGRQRWYVIRHEEMHIRHGDLWVRALGTATLILHWWNPLVWYGMSKMYEDMEMYCDESVMKQCAGAEKKLYADVLLQLSADRSGLAGLCFGESHTEQRIRNILNYTRREPETYMVFNLLYYFIVNLCARILLTVPVL
ncbi:MAG TPA: hypothetical protein DD414_04315 [Lachnospiraceae bacterium]|nr:hypothetical protein [Lachnospiraceae bacterium]